MSNKSGAEKIVQYYQAELAYLRTSGMEFAKRYPKIAEKLDVSDSASSDPHVERMIESFAYMTGKLQKQIDDQFPEIANTLLSILYPPLTMPVPSMTMMHFDADMRAAQQAPGTLVKRGTQVYAKSEDDNEIVCTFKTCHDVNIWPLEIVNVSVVTRDDTGLRFDVPTPFLLKIKMKWHDTGDNRRPEKIRFYINGDHKFKGELFASLFIHNTVSIFSSQDTSVCEKGIEGIGIRDDESMLPYEKSLFRGFRLLHEYFHFSDKFCGFDVTVPSSFKIMEDFDIFLPLCKHIKLPNIKNVLLLNAVPAINLFDHVTDPLRLTHQDISYKLVADAYRNKSTEIMSIKKVVQVDQQTNEQKEVFNFFSSSHRTINSNKDITWYAKRKPSCIAGDDIDIYFVDNEFNPLYPENRIFYAHTTCTNRHIAELIPAFTAFNIEQAVPVKQIYCLQRPTRQKQSICDGESVWTAISLLSNSFMDNYESKLKDILRIFAYNGSINALDEIESISSIKSKKTSKLYRSYAWRGFIRGTAVEVQFAPSSYASGMLLSHVLSHFMSAYTSINTFTELTTITSDIGNKTWDMQTGVHNYL